MPDMRKRTPVRRFSGAASGEEGVFFRDLMAKWGGAGGTRRRLEFRSGEDEDGSLAVWITIFVPADLSPSKQTLEELGRISDKIREEVINSDFGRWPYVQIKTE
jgi:hypothetical protein